MAMDSIQIEPMKVAFIPIRSGSKGIKNKNMKDLGGKPLVQWVVDTVLATQLFDEVWIATDSTSYRHRLLSHYGSSINVFLRSEESATDKSNVGHVVSDFLNFRHLSAKDLFVLFQATSPFISSEDVMRVIQVMTQPVIDGALACHRLKRFRWSDNGVSLDYAIGDKPMRQDYKGFLVECGAFYAARIGSLITRHNNQYAFTLSGNIVPIEVDRLTAIDIDDPYDWTLAESFIPFTYNRL